MALFNNIPDRNCEDSAATSVEINGGISISTRSNARHTTRLLVSFAGRASRCMGTAAENIAVMSAILNIDLGRKNECHFAGTH